LPLMVPPDHRGSWFYFCFWTMSESWTLCFKLFWFIGSWENLTDPWGSG
jgi:hypothetical protein